MVILLQLICYMTFANNIHFIGVAENSQCWSRPQLRKFDSLIEPISKNFLLFLLDIFLFNCALSIPTN